MKNFATLLALSAAGSVLADSVDWSEGASTAGAGVDVTLSAALSANKPISVPADTVLGGIAATNTAEKAFTWILNPETAGTPSLVFSPADGAEASVVDVAANTTLQTALFTSDKPIWKTGPGEDKGQNLLIH